MNTTPHLTIHPRKSRTTILITRASATILYANLPQTPWNARAVSNLLGAVQGWLPRQLRAALVVDERASSSVTNFYLSSLRDFAEDVVLVDRREERGDR